MSYLLASSKSKLFFSLGGKKKSIPKLGSLDSYRLSLTKYELVFKILHTKRKTLLSIRVDSNSKQRILTSQGFQILELST